MLGSCLLCQFARQLVRELFLAGEVNQCEVHHRFVDIQQVRYKDIGHHIPSSIFFNLVNGDHSYVNFSKQFQHGAR